MVTYHYQSIPYFADQWNNPNDTSDNAEDLKTRHGEVGRERERIVVRKRVSKICEETGSDELLMGFHRIGNTAHNTLFVAYQIPS